MTTASRVRRSDARVRSMSMTTRIRCLALLAAILASCNSSPTSVRLEIVAAPTLVLDGLAITVDGDRHVEDMTDSLQILVPDTWAGIAQRFEVEGTQGGATVAAGAVSVTPIAHDEVSTIVTLIDPS